jgi:exopolyphosphatase/pppGpp-phosphohydrolase
MDCLTYPPPMLITSECAFLQEKDDVRLGKGSMGFSIIHPDAEERAISAMKRFQKIAKTRNATLRVVATCKIW